MPCVLTEYELLGPHAAFARVRKEPDCAVGRESVRVGVEQVGLVACLRVPRACER